MENILILGEKVCLEDLMNVARYGYKVEFDEKYRKRVQDSRDLVERWVEEEKVIYGVTTGFGALCTKTISKEETMALQKNIILSHSTSVGTPFTKEEARATMFMILQNLGQGYSGIKLETLEFIKTMLNLDIYPFMPREGSVGYLCPEAHLALTLIGEGKLYYKDELLASKDVLEKLNITPLTLSSKEGLSLVSGTTSVTALGAIALYDMINSSKSADIIAACSLEVSKGIIFAFDEAVMKVRPHKHQAISAKNIRTILNDSQIIEKCKYDRLQDALSLRCVPQLHGAAKKNLYDAKYVIETEINSCCDNPIIYRDDDGARAISACNADSSYVGIEMDSCAIASTMIAKMSERRNNRLIDGNLSANPAFLIKNPGFNSGLMIPQYTQAGLLGDMRILCTPSVIDNTPTCMNQEDYVAMGYNASKKAISIVEKLEYILAIELMSAYQSHFFLEDDLKLSSATDAIYEYLKNYIPELEEDFYLYPHIEYLKDLIHSKKLLDIVENIVGKIK